MAEPKLRWGILGCARITRRGLIPGIRESLSSTLQAIASRDLATAKARAEEFGVPRLWFLPTSARRPRSRRDLHPAPQRAAQVLDSRGGRRGQTRALREAAGAGLRTRRSVAVHNCQKHGVILMEAFMWRHQPRTLEIRKQVVGGAIGELRLIRASFSFPMQGDDWRLDPAPGGGALWDVGCYGVSTARLFAGAEPQKLQAFAHFGDTGVDLSLSALLEFPGGLVATIDCSFEQPFRCVYELVGTRGVIEVPDAYLPPAKEKPTAAAADDRLGLEPGHGWRRSPDTQFEPIDQYAAMVDAFARSVAADSWKTPPRMDSTR